MSLRLRLTLWYTGVLAATLIVFGVAVYSFLSMNLYNNFKNELRLLGEDVYSQVEAVNFVSPTGSRTVIQLPSLDVFQSHVFLQVVNASGEVAAKSSNLAKFNLPISAEVLHEADIAKQPFFRNVAVGNTTLLIEYRPINVKDQFFGVLQVGTSVNHIENYLNAFKIIFTFSAFVLIVLAFSFGWFLARKALKPIDLVIEATDQIEKGTDLDKRIIYDGPNDEIGRLTTTINGMLSRIQYTYSELNEAYRAQRRFVSDASHELRTPLTTIRGNVDLLEKMWQTVSASNVSVAIRDEDKLHLSLEAMQDIASEAERMSRLVNDLLSLARADAGFEMQKQPILLRPLIEDVVRRAQFLPKHAEWKLGDIEALEGIYVMGNEDYLQQLLFIFIDNAFKYTREGSVELSVLRSNEQVGIRISDTGIGMDKEDVPLIFERFYRADPSRGKTMGTGLGLAIAKWIMNEHQGSIEVTTRKGVGSTFVIWLPIYISQDV